MNGLKEEQKKSITNLNVWFYLGAIVIIVPAILIFSDFNRIPTTNQHYFTLIWLGIVASGIGYLLWNSGARKVSSGTLAIMNNAIVPLGILASLLFGSKIDSPTRLAIGGFIIIFALFINKKKTF